MKKLFKKLFPSKEMRAYRKMHHRHRNELVKLAKETREWDWSWLHEGVIMQIRHMYEYYSEGNNICQSEESLDVVLESLKHVLDLQEELEHLFDFASHLSMEITSDNSAHTYWNDGENRDEQAVHAFKREQELYEEIYSYIGKYIRYWWD